MDSFTPVSLLAWLEKNQLLTAAQGAEMRGLLAFFPDARRLVRELLERDWLTAYQANQILPGKGETLILGPYRLVERLGSGTTGQVFKARHALMGRLVAIKIIHKESLARPEAVERFQRELRAAAQLEHPNIVTIFQADEIDDRRFLAMEYVEGIDLARLVKQSGPLPVADACEYVRQAARGLHHAFERGIIHRDIKPSNLLLARAAPESPLVKIVDFSLALLDDAPPRPAPKTQLGTVSGTADYIAPEQAEEPGKADSRSDIYSLGCTLFYLLTGRPPFGGSTVAEKVADRLMADPPTLRPWRTDVPPELEDVLKRMLSREPTGRPQTPAEVAEALTAFTAKPAPLAPTTSVSVDFIPNLSIETIPLPEPPQTAAWTPPVPLAAPVSSESAAVSENPAAAFQELYQPSGAVAATIEPDYDLAAPSAGVVAEPRPRSRRSRLPALVLAWLIGGLVPLAAFLAFVLLRGSSTGPAPKQLFSHPGAELHILPIQDMVLREGRNTFVIVRIQRKAFQGPVTVQVKDLPEGLVSPPTQIPAGLDAAEVKITASFGTADLQHRVRVVARAERESLQAEQSFQVTVERFRESRNVLPTLGPIHSAARSGPPEPLLRREGACPLLPVKGLPPVGIPAAARLVGRDSFADNGESLSAFFA